MGVSRGELTMHSCSTYRRDHYEEGLSFMNNEEDDTYAYLSDVTSESEGEDNEEVTEPCFADSVFNNTYHHRCIDVDLLGTLYTYTSMLPVDIHEYSISSMSVCPPTRRPLDVEVFPHMYHHRCATNHHDDDDDDDDDTYEGKIEGKDDRT